MANFYASSNLNRAHVDEIVDAFSHLTNGGPVQLLKSKVFKVLEKLNPPTQDYQELNLMFESYENYFDGLLTDYQRLQALKESGKYIAPESYVIGSQYRPRTKSNETILNHEVDVGQYIPMKGVLKLFLELPGCLEAILSNLEHLSKTAEPFTNVVQGDLWKHKVQTHFQGKTVLPLFVFFDDFDPDNVIGSHGGDHKLGALYYSIACLPQEYLSKLENIFVASLFLSNCKVHGNDNLFRPVIQDLIDLEENEILINFNGTEKRIYFCLCLLIGDNLGIHSICGFVEGFNANFPCRMCKIHRNEM